MKEGLRAWLRRPENARRLLVESGALADDLARFRRWWRPDWGAGVDLERPETWFDVDLEESIPLQVGWPGASAEAEIIADAVLRLTWRRPEGRATSWAGALQQAAFAGTQTVYIRLQPELPPAAELLPTFAQVGTGPWVILTAGVFLYGTKGGIHMPGIHLTKADLEAHPVLAAKLRDALGEDPKGENQGKEQDEGRVENRRNRNGGGRTLFFFVPLRDLAQSRIDPSKGYLEAVIYSEHPDDEGAIRSAWKWAPRASFLACYGGEVLASSQPGVHLFRPAELVWVRQRQETDGDPKNPGDSGGAYAPRASRASNSSSNENNLEAKFRLRRRIALVLVVCFLAAAGVGYVISLAGSSRSASWVQAAPGETVPAEGQAGMAGAGAPGDPLNPSNPDPAEASSASSSASSASSSALSPAQSSASFSSSAPAPNRRLPPPAPAWVKANAVGDYSSGLSYCLEWAPVQGAVRYELYEAGQPMSTNDVWEQFYISVQAPKTQGCFWHPDGVAPPEWLRVRAVNAAGRSAPREILTPPPPITLGEAGGAGGGWAGFDSSITHVNIPIFKGPAADSLHPRDRQLVLTAYDQLAEWFGEHPKITFYLYPTREEYLVAGGSEKGVGTAVDNEHLLIDWNRGWTVRRQVLVHEMVHGFQYAHMGGYCTPNWVAEGLANYLTDKIVFWGGAGDSGALSGIENLIRGFRLGRHQAFNMVKDFLSNDTGPRTDAFRDDTVWQNAKDAALYDKANLRVSEAVDAAGGIEEYIKRNLRKDSCWRR